MKIKKIKLKNDIMCEGCPYLDMAGKYSKLELEQALIDFEGFIKMSDYINGIPIRLKIVRDLIKKELKNYE